MSISPLQIRTKRVKTSLVVKARCHPKPGNGVERAQKHFEAAERLFAARQIRRALAHYVRAAELGADPNQGTLNRWTCFMLLGRFEDAWRETDRTEALRRLAGDSRDG